MSPSELMSYPAFQDFLTRMNESSFLRGIGQNVSTLQRKYGDDYCRFAESILQAAHAMEFDPIEVFTEYIYAYMRDLARFEQSGEYDNGSFEEIRESIYDNDELMTDTYLPGLFMAYGFTSLMYEKFRFFQQHVLPQIQAGMRGIEIGFGDGIYLWHILRTVEASAVDGIDISPSAVRFSTRLLHSESIAQERFRLKHGDAGERIDAQDQTYDWCILTEVIEHVADPTFTLGEIHRIIKPGGLFYMSTVIDSNHMDHITNFADAQEVIDLLAANGFHTADHLVYVVAEEIEGVNDKAIGLAFKCVRQ